MNKKQAYQEKLQAQLDEWEAKINVLKAKSQRAEADAKVQYQETIETLEKKKADAKDKFQELRQASDTAWHDLKEGVEQAWANLEEGIKQASSRFK